MMGPVLYAVRVRTHLKNIFYTRHKIGAEPRSHFAVRCARHIKKLTFCAGGARTRTRSKVAQFYPLSCVNIHKIYVRHLLLLRISKEKHKFTTILKVKASSNHAPCQICKSDFKWAHTVLHTGTLIFYIYSFHVCVRYHFGFWIKLMV